MHDKPMLIAILALCVAASEGRTQGFHLFGFSVSRFSSNSGLVSRTAVRRTGAAPSQPSWIVSTLCALDPSADGTFYHLHLDGRDSDRIVVSDEAAALYQASGLLGLSKGGTMRLTLLHGLAGHMVEPGAQDGDLCRTHSRPTPYHASQGVATGMGGAEVAGAYTDPPLSGPRGMCEDAHGNLWVANTEAANILRWDAETGNWSSVAGVANVKGWVDGESSRARFAAPVSLACLPDGSVVVGDVGNKAPRLIVCTDNCPPAPGGRWGTLMHWGRIAFIVTILASVLWGITYAGALYVRARIDNMRGRHTGPNGGHLSAGDLNPESRGVDDPSRPLIQIDEDHLLDAPPPSSS